MFSQRENSNDPNQNKFQEKKLGAASNSLLSLTNGMLFEDQQGAVDLIRFGITNSHLYTTGKLGGKYSPKDIGRVLEVTDYNKVGHSPLYFAKNSKGKSTKDIINNKLRSNDYSIDGFGRYDIDSFINKSTGFFGKGFMGKNNPEDVVTHVNLKDGTLATYQFRIIYKTPDNEYQVKQFEIDATI
jgi:hypothetical protein